MSWKNAREAKRDLREWGNEVGVSGLAVAKHEANDLAEHVTVMIRQDYIRDLFHAFNLKDMRDPERNILKYTIRELIRHLGHVRSIAQAVEKTVDNPDKFAQNLILTLKEYQPNPEIDELVGQFMEDLTPKLDDEEEELEEEDMIDLGIEDDDEFDDYEYDDDDDFDFLDEEDDDY